ncbi:MAG: ABC transporter permease [Arachnia sp.]
MRLRTIIADRRIFLVVLIVLSGLVMSLLSPYFFRVDNLLSMTQYGSVIGLLALGQALVILGGGGGIDLSIGATLSLSGVVMGLMTEAFGINPWLAAVIAIGCGALLGAINGLLITKVGLLPLIATLSTMFLYTSLANVVTGGRQFGGFDVSNFRMLGQGAVLGIPVQVLFVTLPAFGIAIWAMSRTRFGQETYEVGSSSRAASLVGVSVPRHRISLYVIAGSLAGLGAVVTNAWLLTARPSAGTGLELQAITIAVLGGIDIWGGKGHLTGVLLGLLLVVVVNNGLQLAGVGNSIQVGILGAILIGSVLLNTFLTRGRSAA